jgi:hypothetical protein
MLQIRRADERGRTSERWLESRHAFAFGEYADPKWPGFRALRVVNEDRIAPGSGSGMLTHRDVEIVTWVLDGALEQHDASSQVVNLGPGDVQRLTAGSGFEHSERNGSKDKPLRYLQMWFVPSERFLAPDRQSITITPAELQGRLRLVASPNGRDGSLRLHQDASIYASRLTYEDSAALVLGTGRHAWVQVLRGEVTLNGTALGEGDAAAMSNQNDLALETQTRGEVLVVDLG